MTKFYAQEKRVFDIDKITIVGSPSITSDGVASGFTSSNYIRCGQGLLVGANTWQIEFEYDTKNMQTNQVGTIFQNVLLSPNYSGLVIQGRYSSVTLYASSGVGATWDILGGKYIQINPNAKNIIAVGYDGIKYYCIVNGQEKWSLESDLKISFPNTNCIIGHHSWWSALVNASLDLTQFKIYVDDELVYSPTKPVYFLERRKEGFDLSKFTVVGNPTINEDGVASGFSSATNKYIEVPFNYLTEDFKIKLKFTTGQTITNSYLFGTYQNNDIFSIWRNSTLLEPRVFFNVDGVRTSSYDLFGTKYISITLETLTCYDLLIERKDGYITFACKKESDETYKQVQFEANYPLFLSTNGNIRISNDIGASIDLPSFSIIVDGKEVFTGAKEKFYAMRGM